MDPSAQYRDRLAGVFAKVKESFVRRLREFIALPVPPDADYVDFEEIADPHGKEFPVLIALHVRPEGILCGSERCFFASVPFSLPPELNPAASDCGVVDASADYAEFFFPWFQDCWIAAGGLRYPLPAFVGERDGFDWLDLSSGQWVDRMK